VGGGIIKIILVQDTEGQKAITLSFQRHVTTASQSETSNFGIRQLLSENPTSAEYFRSLYHVTSGSSLIGWRIHFRPARSRVYGLVWSFLIFEDFEDLLVFLVSFNHIFMKYVPPRFYRLHSRAIQIHQFNPIYN